MIQLFPANVATRLREQRVNWIDYLKDPYSILNVYDVFFQSESTVLFIQKGLCPDAERLATIDVTEYIGPPERGQDGDIEDKWFHRDGTIMASAIDYIGSYATLECLKGPNGNPLYAIACQHDWTENSYDIRKSSEVEALLKEILLKCPKYSEVVPEMYLTFV